MLKESKHGGIIVTIEDELDLYLVELALPAYRFKIGDKACLYIPPEPSAIKQLHEYADDDQPLTVRDQTPYNV